MRLNEVNVFIDILCGVPYQEIERKYEIDKRKVSYIKKHLLNILGRSHLGLMMDLIDPNKLKGITNELERKINERFEARGRKRKVS